MAQRTTVVLNDEIAEMVGWVQGTSEAYEELEDGNDPFDADVRETEDGEFEAEVSFSEDVVDGSTLSIGITKLVVIGLLTLGENEDIDEWEIAETITRTPVNEQNEIEEFQAVRDSYFSLWG